MSIPSITGQYRDSVFGWWSSKFLGFRTQFLQEGNVFLDALCCGHGIVLRNFASLHLFYCLHWHVSVTAEIIMLFSCILYIAVYWLTCWVARHWAWCGATGSRWADAGNPCAWIRELDAFDFCCLISVDCSKTQSFVSFICEGTMVKCEKPLLKTSENMFSGECVDSRRSSSSNSSSSRSSSRIRSRESSFWNSQLRCHSPCPRTEIFNTKSKKKQYVFFGYVQRIYIYIYFFFWYVWRLDNHNRHVGRSENGFVDPNPNTWGAVKRGRTSWADVKDDVERNSEFLGKIWKWIDIQWLIYLPYELTYSFSYCTHLLAYLLTYFLTYSRKV